MMAALINLDTIPDTNPDVENHLCIVFLLRSMLTIHLYMEPGVFCVLLECLIELVDSSLTYHITPPKICI